jgi:methylenetetrahydrofolate reductase (NADPH)
LASLFDGSDTNPKLRGLLVATIAAEQCRLLSAAGIEELRFRMLNRAKLTLGPSATSWASAHRCRPGHK